MDESRLSCTSDAFAALSQGILHKGKSLRFIAQGSSMHPLVRNCDTLLVAPFESRRIQIGDVVLVSPAAGCLVVHRVIRRKITREGTRYLVKGDQASQPDGWFPQEQIKARLMEIERDGQKIEMDWLRMRFLGLITILRSKWQFGRKGISAHLVHLAKKLPVFSDLLS